jgi:ArsR family transcriptional regulator
LRGRPDQGKYSFIRINGYMTDLAATTDLLGLLADPTRIRLLALLGTHELTVGEIVRTTGLPQSRVSTHLGKLRDAGLVRDRRFGPSTFYRIDEPRMPEAARRAWTAVKGGLEDATLRDDLERCEEVVGARDERWPDAVAGRMEHHYSPGRTWEAMARAFAGLMQLGDVLDVGSGDGAIAALLAPRARSLTCLDRSDRVIDAARERLAGIDNVRFVSGDMHTMPLPDAAFDQVLLFSVLTYANDPARVVAEAFRVLRPGGVLALVTLDEHSHLEVSSTYDHVNAGFSPVKLRALLERAGFSLRSCDVTSRERRKPYFQVVSAFAERPAVQGRARLRAS